MMSAVPAGSGDASAEILVLPDKVERSEVFHVTVGAAFDVEIVRTELVTVRDEESVMVISNV